MPRKQKPSRAGASEDSAFLRSINVRLDADLPERVAHFEPTSKSVELLRRLTGLGPERATLAVAPYGTGKSLAAAFALHVLENRSEGRKVLSSVNARLKSVSPDLALYVSERGKRQSQALVLTLSGFNPDLCTAIRDAAVDSFRRLGRGRTSKRLARLDLPEGADRSLRMVKLVRESAAAEDLDRVALIWDEFGRHLESVASSGQSGSLHEIQNAAEIAVRAGVPPLSLCLLLHRGLMHYAASLPQSAVSEWKKVEGRFDTLQYVEDSKEIYWLISRVASHHRRCAGPSPRECQAQAHQAQALGIFREFGAAQLRALLELAYPLEPVTLFLLPRLAGRVAQNERTVFGFLFSQSLRASVPVSALYDYFAPAMQADIGPGGTFKQWLETQSAIGKASELPEGAELLKTACLLGLGASGDRSRTPRALLEFAARGFRKNDISDAIQHLIERKLLLHRRHSDDLTVWHGTDLDIRGRLEEERARHRSDFQLVPFLTKEVPPPNWRPTRYNDEHGVRRHFGGQYQTPQGLETLFGSDLPLGSIPAGDGSVLYLVTETGAEVRAAEDLATQTGTDKRLVAAVSRGPLPLTEAALELFCLLRMSLDSDLIGSDPLVGGELQQMIDDSRSHLVRLVERLTLPAPGGARWFSDGHEQPVSSVAALRELLSLNAETVFAKTPRIFNEMIVRRRPSAVVVNARKKLVMGIIERSGTPDLGLKGDFPDASMFRTVLVRTGLYRESGSGVYRYAQPGELPEAGLAAVWRELEIFFTQPSDQPKPAGSLLQRLLTPPYGVREGLLPIFFAAGLKAFATSVALQRDGEYLQDILPSDVELLCREPDRFGLVVLTLDGVRRQYLLGLLDLFKMAVQPNYASTELIRLAHEVLNDWRRQLPPGAWTASGLSEQARSFVAAIQQETDPVALFFRRLPRACGAVGVDDPESLLRELSAVKGELEAVVSRYREEASRAIRRATQLTDAPGIDLRTVTSTWANCFDERLLAHSLDGVARGLVQRAKERYGTDEVLIDSLGSLLVGRTTARWDDASLLAFQRELTSVVRRVEEVAASALDASSLDPAAAARLALLVAGRLRGYFASYLRLAGPDAAEQLMAELAGDPTGRGEKLGNTR